MSGVDDLVAWLRAQYNDQELVIADMDTVIGDVLGTRKQAEDELAVKRRILDLHQENAFSECLTCRERSGGDYPCPTARLLALPYADRPGYRPEWKP